MPKLLYAAMLAGAAIFAATAAADAQPNLQMTYRQAGWIAAGGRANDGMPMCMMGTFGPEGRSFQIKWFAGNDGLIVQMFKTGWKVPMDARVPVLVGIDRAGTWSANAVGRGNSIFFRVLGDKIPAFMKQITFGSILQVAFPSGNEQPWSGRLAGSGGAVAALLRCIKQVKGLEQPTQPYSTQPVQPIAPPQPTQPFTGVVNPAQRAPTLERRT